MAVAFVNLLAAEAEDTQQVMQSLKRVSAKSEPMMEARQGKKTYKHPDGRVLVLYHGGKDGGEWFLFPNSQAEGDDAIASGEYYAAGDKQSEGFMWVARGGRRGVDIAGGAPIKDLKLAAQAIFQQFPNA
jgi:hypothetical protein